MVWTRSAIEEILKRSQCDNASSHYRAAALRLERVHFSFFIDVSEPFELEVTL